MKKTLFALLSLFVISGSFGDALARDKEPTWVKHLAWSPPIGKSAEGDYEDLLKDVQINRLTRETYVRFAFRYLTSQAVQSNSSVSIDYAPDYQKVRLHTISIWHDGVATDQTNAAFRSLQRERELEEALYSGHETWVGFLKNVRPGDILEVAYTIAGENPIFEGKYADDYALETSFAMASWNLRVLAPAGRSPLVRAFGTDKKPQTSIVGGLEETKWAFQDVPQLRTEDNVPNDARPGGRYVLSDWDTWEGVARWALPAYQPRVTNTIAKLAKDLTKDLGDPAEKAQALLQYVQNQIRYFGVEVGSYSHFPHDPDEVLGNGYGDCKDKAVLFCALSKAAGLNAWAVLVHTRNGQRVAQDGPTPLAFNHVIAALELPEGTQFVDPTAADQGSRLALQILGGYEWGLELKAGVKQLTALPGYSLGKRDLVQDFWFTDYSGPADVDMVYTYSGSDAVYQRSRWASLVTADWKKQVTEDLHDEYGESTITKGPTVSDDPDENLFTLRFSFRIEKLWEKKDNTEKSSYYPALVKAMLYNPTSLAARETAYWLEHPVRVTQARRVHFPDDWQIESTNVPIQAPGFTLVTSAKMVNPRLFEMTDEYTSTADRVAPEQWKDYLEALKKARYEVSWQLTHRPSAETKADDNGSMALGIGALTITGFLLAILSLGGDF